ncbi:hypothetical protein OC835_002408 [Tilletia horrida]|nr:hypothetical protein OC835_002408 [Tilletia horrida]
MRLTHALTLSLVAATSAVQAQYYNQGWKPGQPAQLPIHGDLGDAAAKLQNSQGQQEKQSGAGWTPPKHNPAAPQPDQENTGIAGLIARFTAKAYPNITFNAAVATLTHTPHLAPLWGKKLSAAELSAQGSTIEDQLGVPRSSVVSAARGARAVEDSAPWARARMAGGAVEGAGVGSGSSRASALSFEPWVVLISSKHSDATSTRFNTVFNDTVNLIHPPAAGQEAAPAEADSLATMPDEETEDDKRVIEDVLLKNADALKRLRFGHVDYLTEPAVSWHWWIWKVPIVLFITPSSSPERAYDIRFWRLAARPPSKARFLAIISDENKWKQLPIWTSKMAPGGERDHIPERISIVFSYFYVVMEKIPGPVVPIVAAMLAQPLLGWMHKRSARADLN